MVAFTKKEEQIMQRLAKVEAFRKVPFVVSLKVMREHNLDFLKVVGSLESFLDLSQSERKLCAQACLSELKS